MYFWVFSQSQFNNSTLIDDLLICSDNWQPSFVLLILQNQDNQVILAFADSEGILIEKPWFRVLVRRGTKIAASGLVFLEGEAGYWAQLIFSDSRVPPGGYFTYCSDGRSRGNAREAVQIATPDSSLHCLWRKEWWYPFKPQYPYCKCGDMLFSRGARPNCTQRCMICLMYKHSGENAHDLQFGITVPYLTPFLEKI